MTNTETATAVTFDEVEVGDVLRYTHIARGFVGGGEIRTITATVERITANTVFLAGGSRLTRSRWYEDAHPRRVTK